MRYNVEDKGLSVSDHRPTRYQVQLGSRFERRHRSRWQSFKRLDQTSTRGNNAGSVLGSVARWLAHEAAAIMQRCVGRMGTMSW